jgi:hypothetical protein
VLSTLLADTTRHVVALVPCRRSARRVAVSAASSAADHSWSVLASPHTWFGVKPKSSSTVRNGWAVADHVEELSPQLDW